MRSLKNFLTNKKSCHHERIVLKGVPAAPGIAYGPAFILDKGEFIVPKRSILPPK